MQKFYFLHADKNKYDTVISMENNDPLGSQYISKIENFFVGGFSSQFGLPQRFSIVQVGSYLWLFGKWIFFAENTAPIIGVNVYHYTYLFQAEDFHSLVATVKGIDH